MLCKLILLSNFKFRHSDLGDELTIWGLLIILKINDFLLNGKVRFPRGELFSMESIQKEGGSPDTVIVKSDSESGHFGWLCGHREVLPRAGGNSTRSGKGKILRT